MSAAPVLRAAAGGLTRRRVPGIVTLLVVLVSAAASVLALALLADSRSPFDHAFVAQRGADLTVTVDSAKASVTELAAAARRPGVTAAAGPFPEATITPGLSPAAGGPLPVMTLVGRSAGGGPVDDVTLQAGHWARGPGQLVLASDPAPGQGISLPLGTRITVTSAPGRPVLTIVGIGSSVTSSADGWVTPGEVSALRAAGTPPAAQLLLRLSPAGTSARLRAAAAGLRRSLPPGTVTATATYLAVRSQEASNIATFVPFVVAFAVIGLVISVLIVANVVSGAVVAGYRRIGVLKSIGFSPGQVVAAYVSQAAVPAVAGAAVGVVLGNLLAIPLLAQAAGAYGVGALHVPAWVDGAVPAGLIALTGIAAVLPALRAGRLSAVQAIALGRAPRPRRGYAAHRLLGALTVAGRGLPRPVSIGLAAPFARPARTVVTLAAVLLGAVTVIFGVGLATSLHRVVTALSHDQSEQVQVILSAAGGGGPGSRVVGPGGAVRAQASAGHGGGGQGPGRPRKLPLAATAERAVTAALRAQPGTRHDAAEADVTVSVAGLAEPVQVAAFENPAAWTGYELISGRWYTGPGQADAATGFLTATGASVGDTVTLTYDGRPRAVRIVGQIFDTDNKGLFLTTGAATLTGTGRPPVPDQYQVALRPGISATAYAAAVGARLGPAYFVSASQRSSTTLNLILGLIGTLTLLLAVVAGLGVLNTVVLHTRERVHDLGVFKAVGMSPRQAVVMVVCWVAGTGLVAGVIAVPAGIALHRSVLPAMASAAGTGLPAAIMNAYGGWELAGLALAGAVIAVAGALLPATWAARLGTAAALHAE